MQLSVSSLTWVHSSSDFSKHTIYYTEFPKLNIELHILMEANIDTGNQEEILNGMENGFCFTFIYSKTIFAKDLSSQ